MTSRTVRQSPSAIARLKAHLLRWFDNSRSNLQEVRERLPDQIDWLRILPFMLMHVACLAAFWVGVSPVAITVAIVAYLVRMFAITGFYHRYFSHRSFKTSRAGQFIFGLLGASAVQRGPVWWAAHHRHHHAHSDLENDVHSPVQHGFFWSHMGWFMARDNFAPRLELVRRLEQFPELRFLDRYDALVSPRAFRPPLTPYAAMECLLRQSAAGDVDPEVVRALLMVQSLFPIGSYVVLSDGLASVSVFIEGPPPPK